MQEEDRVYFERRRDEERRRAQNASDLAVAGIHSRMADEYDRRLHRGKQVGALVQRRPTATTRYRPAGSGVQAA